MNGPPPHRIIISGGGTGGHVFPAIAIAGALKQRLADPDILFVGARGRMEMKRVPAAGYRIVGLPVEGFRRKISLSNIAVLIKLLRSLHLAGKILRDFRPQVVIGVGGYASGPVLRKAARRGIPTLIQEQNSYAGITNRLLASQARTICVAYGGMDKYFPAEKLVLTGNPVREEIRRLMSPDLSGAGGTGTGNSPSEHASAFGLEEKDPVLLIIGGSLGARTINRAVQGALGQLSEAGIYVIWQCGSMYFEEARMAVSRLDANRIRVHDFIDRMDLAYRAADVIIARSGALTISELCIAGKPAILVPSPNVAEDHQTRNAESLTGHQAALMVADREAEELLIPMALQLMQNADERQRLAGNIKKLARPDSAAQIAEEAIKLMS